MSLDDILVSAEEMKGKKDPKIMPFRKYFDAVERTGMMKWIKESIEKRPDRTVVAKISDVAKEMGPAFEISHFTTIYTGLKYVLFQDDIMLGLGFHRDGDRVFIMKEKKQGDKLPSSYKRIEERAIRKAKRDEKYSEEIKVKYAQILKEKDEVKKEKMEIRKERDSIYEEFLREKNSMEDEFRKERKVMQETIKRLRDELGRRREKGNYIVEIFKIDWKNLEWKKVRQKMVKTDDTLFSTIKEFSSKSPEERFRIEVTEIDEIPEIVEGESSGEEDKIEKNGEQTVIEIPERPSPESPDKKLEKLKTGDKKVDAKT